jgi:hypothetical protein
VLCCWLFERELYIENISGGFTTGKINTGQFSKSLGAAQRNLLSNRCEGFELAGCEKLTSNSKAFGAEQKNLLIQ